MRTGKITVNLDLYYFTDPRSRSLLQWYVELDQLYYGRWLFTGYILPDRHWCENMHSENLICSSMNKPRKD